MASAPSRSPTCTSTITGYQLGIDLSHVTNSHVVGVTCVANNAEGLFIEESSGNQIVNNVADGNGINGIFLTPSSKGNHIDGNVANANVFAGIHVDAGATDNQVHGNGAFGNGSGDDLRDDNPGCDDNNWNGNHFATSNQTCIH